MKLRRLARANGMVYRNDINALAEWINRHMVEDNGKAINPKLTFDLAEELVRYLETTRSRSDDPAKHLNPFK